MTLKMTVSDDYETFTSNTTVDNNGAIFGTMIQAITQFPQNDLTQVITTHDLAELINETVNEAFQATIQLDP